MKNALSIIVPTKDRPDKLKALLESMAGQSVLPLEVIIVDGGDKQVDGMLKDFPDLAITYVRCFPPSLTKQRNAGIRKVSSEATLAGFLDDDIVLEPDAIANMLRFWDTASDDTGGAGFNLTNEIYKRPSLIEKLFMVNADRPSRVLRSGFQSKVAFREETARADWLVGCVMTWRKHIFEEFLFDEFFSGYARYEDVDFSYRVGRKYKLYIVHDARVWHMNELENIDFSFALGRMEVTNRLYFTKKHPELSLPLCYWACSGIFLNNVVKGFILGDRRYALRSRGNMAAFRGGV